MGGEFFYGFSLFGPRILDRLRFIENDIVPGTILNPLVSLNQAVGRDDQIEGLELVPVRLWDFTWRMEVGVGGQVSGLGKKV